MFFQDIYFNLFVYPFFYAQKFQILVSIFLSVGPDIRCTVLSGTCAVITQYASRARVINDGLCGSG